MATHDAIDSDDASSQVIGSDRSVAEMDPIEATIDNHPMVQILTPPSRLKILATMAGRYGSESAQWIIDQTEIHPDTFYEQAAILEEWGLLTVDHVEGNSKFYRTTDGQWNELVTRLSGEFARFQPHRDDVALPDDEDSAPYFECVK